MHFIRLPFAQPVEIYGVRLDDFINGNTPAPNSIDPPSIGGLRINDPIDWANAYIPFVDGVEPSHFNPSSSTAAHSKIQTTASTSASSSFLSPSPRHADSDSRLTLPQNSSTKDNFHRISTSLQTHPSPHSPPPLFDNGSTSPGSGGGSEMSSNDTIMFPTKKNTSSRPRSASSGGQSLRIRKPFKQRRIPKKLNGVASDIFLVVFYPLTICIARSNLRSQVGRFYKRQHTCSQFYRPTFHRRPANQ